MKYEIKHRFTEAVLFTADIPDDTPSRFQCRAALEQANAARANLRYSNLSGSNLSSSDLSGSNLSSSDLRGSDLRGSNLSGSDLRGSDLRGSNLSSSNLSSSDLSGSDLSGSDLSSSDLRGSDLSYSNLSGSDLSYSNLSGSNLRYSDLRGSDLRGSDLRGSDLRGSNLSGANLSGAKGAEISIAKTRILPAGSLIGWKKCSNGVIVKLRIPEEAKRSHAFGRKCRAEFVDVLEVIGAEVGIAQHDGKTEYRAGQRVTPDSFSDNWQEECANGIHFFITREEAQEY